MKTLNIEQTLLKNNTIKEHYIEHYALNAVSNIIESLAEEEDVLRSKLSVARKFKKMLLSPESIKDLEAFAIEIQNFAETLSRRSLSGQRIFELHKQALNLSCIAAREQVLIDESFSVFDE